MGKMMKLQLETQVKRNNPKGEQMQGNPQKGRSSCKTSYESHLNWKD